MTFSNEVPGYGNEIFSTYPKRSKWMYGTEKYVDARKYIKDIKLRTNTLETRVVCGRGFHTNKQCRLCKKGEESIMHIL